MRLAMGKFIQWVPEENGVEGVIGRGCCLLLGKGSKASLEPGIIRKCQVHTK